jgi:hypothetical protein
MVAFVEDRLDVVAVRVANVGRVVARRIAAHAGCSVIGAAGIQRRAVEALDRRSITRLEGQVHARGGGPVGAHVQLIDPEVVSTLAAQLPAERCQGGAIEAAAGLQVAGPEMDVIEQRSELIAHRCIIAPWRIQHRQPGAAARRRCRARGWRDGRG